MIESKGECYARSKIRKHPEISLEQQLEWAEQRVLYFRRVSDKHLRWLHTGQGFSEKYLKYHRNRIEVDLSLIHGLRKCLGKI